MNVAQTTTQIQPQSLMERRSQASSHNINGGKSGPSSAFADYLFGPLSTTGSGPTVKSSMALNNAAQAAQGRSKS